MQPPIRYRGRFRRTGLLLALPTLWSCAGAPAGSPLAATDAEWRALALPRPAPLPGSARVALEPVGLAAAPAWEPVASVDAELAVTELAIAGMLGRRDVVLVERRRFAAAVRSERAGEPRRAGAPRAGVSPGAEYRVTAVWARLDAGPGTVDVRLAETSSGVIAATVRAPVRGGTDPVSIARTVVAATLEALDRLGRRPAWEDPEQAPGGTSTDPAVPSASLASFLMGLAAEEAWGWEAARRAYQRAAETAGFPEAMAALARTARLRNGGTLGES